MICLLAMAGPSGGQAADMAKAWAVPTFESLGLYYNQPQGDAVCRVLYRKAGTGEWREGYPLV
jgi:hypothetical protein